MGTATNVDCYDFHSGNSLPPYTSINAQAQDYFALPAYPRVEVREFDDGIFIRLSSGISGKWKTVTPTCKSGGTTKGEP